MTQNPIDELIQQVLQALPQGVGEFRQDLDQQLRLAIETGLRRLDLVTRKEFDVQREVLQRTRTQLAKMEQQIAELETAVKNNV